MPPTAHRVTCLARQCKPMPGIKLRFLSGSGAVAHLGRCPQITLVKDKGDGAALFKLKPRSTLGRWPGLNPRQTTGLHSFTIAHPWSRLGCLDSLHPKRIRPDHATAPIFTANPSVGIAAT